MGLHLLALLLFVAAAALVARGAILIYRILDAHHAANRRRVCGPRGCYCRDSCEWMLFGGFDDVR